MDVGLIPITDQIVKNGLQLFIEPALKTNQPRKKLLQSEAPDERVYDPHGTGVSLKKGNEVRFFSLMQSFIIIFIC